MFDECCRGPWVSANAKRCADLSEPHAACFQSTPFRVAWSTPGHPARGNQAPMSRPHRALRIIPILPQMISATLLSSTLCGKKKRWASSRRLLKLHRHLGISAPLRVTFCRGSHEDGTETLRAPREQRWEEGRFSTNSEVVPETQGRKRTLHSGFFLTVIAPYIRMYIHLRFVFMFSCAARF